jgi:hypothetical protein
MIVIDKIDPKDCVEGYRVEIDADRSIVVLSDGSGIIINVCNGEMMQRLALTNEAAHALFLALEPVINTTAP